MNVYNCFGYNMVDERLIQKLHFIFASKMVADDIFILWEAFRYFDGYYGAVEPAWTGLMHACFLWAFSCFISTSDGFIRWKYF